MENINTTETLATKILQVPETTLNGLWQTSKKRLFSLDTTPVDRLHIPGGDTEADQHRQNGHGELNRHNDVLAY